MSSLVRDVARSLCLRDQDEVPKQDQVVRTQPRPALKETKTKKTRDIYLREGPISFSVNNELITCEGI